MMNLEFLERTESLIGRDNIEKLINSKVAIFGVGGVGSGTCEVLARSGVGNFLIVDFDTIDITNLNRQIITTRDNIGKEKSKVQKDRILSINPQANVLEISEKVSFENVETFNLKEYDYVIDTIDDVKGKLALIKYCKDNKINIISAMGAAKKLDPFKLKITDIYNTKVCPLARKMRKNLKALGVENLKVIYSEEEPIESKLDVLPSIVFVTCVSGMILGGEVIKDLIKH